MGKNPAFRFCGCLFLLLSLGHYEKLQQKRLSSPKHHNSSRINNIRVAY